jgi:transposase-like protein
VSKWHGATQFYAPEPRFWPAAKTANRLERLFGELRRRIRVFRKFLNTLSCQR